MKFEEELKAAGLLKKERYARLIKHFDEEQLTDKEKIHLLSLCFDDEEEQIIGSLFLKAKK